jgi:endonuclease YncB( thermonuclease family)
VTNLKKTGVARLAFLGCLLFVLNATEQSSAQTWYTVKWVNDGDTIVLANGQRVRYIGIDTPEIDHENQTAEPFSYAARSFNESLIALKKIRLEFDEERHDPYGRLLAYLFLEDGTFMNARLLQNGLAYCLYRAPNLKYNSILLQSQQNAMNAKIGIWQNWKNKTEKFIGNRSSRRFHLASCPFAKSIASANRIVFPTKWDAFWAGYAPAKKCVTEFWSY